MGRSRLNNYTPEQMKFFNKINARLRNLVKQEKVGTYDIIQTLYDIGDGIELVQGKDGEGFTLSRATKLTADIMKTLEEYVDKPSKFNYDTSKLAVMRVTADDFYMFMDSNVIENAINDLVKSGIMDRATAEEAINISDIRSKMSDYGRAYRDGDNKEAIRLRNEVLDLLHGHTYYNAAKEEAKAKGDV